MRTAAYDRHLRRARQAYRRRRGALAAALTRALPAGMITGIDAGLHLTLLLPDGADEGTVASHLQARGVAVETLGEHRIAAAGPPGILLGYAALAEPTLRLVAGLIGDALGL